MSNEKEELILSIETNGTPESTIIRDQYGRRVRGVASISINIDKRELSVNVGLCPVTCGLIINDLSPNEVEFDNEAVRMLKEELRISPSVPVTLDQNK